jgi:hypothetical protein
LLPERELDLLVEVDAFEVFDAVEMPDALDAVEEVLFPDMLVFELLEGFPDLLLSLFDWVVIVVSTPITPEPEVCFSHSDTLLWEPWAIVLLPPSLEWLNLL